VTRRITLTMVAVVAGALVVATLGTLVISRASDRRAVRRELGRQAQRLAARIEDAQTPRALRIVGAALRLEGESVVAIGPNGMRTGTLPPGVSAADLDVGRLRQGRTLTGAHGPLVFAAAPARTRNDLVNVIVLTRRVGRTQGVGPWVLLVGAVTLAVAAAVAANLGRRLIRPLREAQQATRRIAGGDLAARVPVHPEDGEDLATLARSINLMAASLERSRGLERQFLLSVSHDLRTPLTSIRGYAEALAEGQAPDPPQAASVIVAESRRLERLVGDLLELAQLGARRFSLDVRATDVAEVVGDTADGFLPAAEGAGVTLEVDVPAPGLALAAADPGRLAQVVANLVENALKFARSRIAVGATAGSVPERSGGGGSVDVWVEDDGPGIDAADLPHVFEPFYRSARSPTRQVGTGLGLAIVHELVDAMGGSVRAEAGVATPFGHGAGGGTRVVVSLKPWSTAGG
jgi:two-component system sensor histidine kinase BaeS